MNSHGTQNDTLQENVEPIDYEDFLDQHQLEADRDPHSKILYFPPDDIVVNLIPRQIRTIHPIVPEERWGPEEKVMNRDLIEIMKCAWNLYWYFF